MPYKFLDKKPSGGAVNCEIMSSQELLKELHKRSTRKFKKGKAHSSFKDNIWDADLADMQLISKCNKGNRFLACLFSKCAWLVSLKDKKVITITNAFQKF